jgi:hypothetical protein
MYARGEGVTLDYQQAYIWLSIAISTADCNECIVRVRDFAESRLTPERLEEAKKQIADLVQAIEKNKRGGT